ncbi:unnamed protein product [Sphagnum jensenii]|uniref:Uncharacterized protein n=1 Tax=Sphagnum jensenii TaxID=128206 RepID=A0ABP1AWM2_9BRYO
MPDKGKSCYKGTDHTTVFPHATIVILDLLSRLLETNVESRDKLGEAINLLSGGNENGSTSQSMHFLYQLHGYNWKFGEKLEEIIGLLQKQDAGHCQTDGNENVSTSRREGANLEQSDLRCLLTGMPSNYNPESIPVIPEYLPQEPCLANSQGTEEGEQNTPGVYDWNETHMLEDSEECCLKIYLAQAKIKLVQMEEDAPTPESEDEMVG